MFSQYSNTLEWLKQRLPEEGFGYRTITGSMPLKQRSKAIEVRALQASCTDGRKEAAGMLTGTCHHGRPWELHIKLLCGCLGLVRLPFW